MSNQDPQQASEMVSPDRVELDRLRKEHAAVVRALQEAIRDTTRLTRLFAVLNDSAPLEQLLERVVATLSELFVSDIVVLLDATSNSGLVPLAAIGLPWATEFRSLPATGDGYSARALNQAAPVVAVHAQDDPKVEPTLRELDVEAAVWLPVAGDHGIRRGVLILARCRPLGYAQADVDLLRTMAYRVGLLVERAHADRERRLLEVKVRQAEKTESLGRMAAAVAHHFNNMLAIVVAGLDLALEDMSSEHSTRDDLVHAREAAMRAAETGELMLTYIGQSSGEREIVDLVQVLRDSLPTAQSNLAKHVRLTVDLGDTALMILANAPQITQMLGHLVANAKEAIGPRRGEIRLAVRAVPSNAIETALTSSLDWTPKVATYACIELSDTGSGMSAETIEKIFDPFFTTKFVGRGLGLPVVQGTVRAHEGHITVESELDRGTTICVFLPLAQPVLQPKHAASRAPERRQPRSPVVLVAEDEATLRRSTKRILNRMGYEVLVAADGIEATDLFRAHSDEIGLVILDLAMPRMDGWAALEVVRELHPTVPVIIATGYDETRAMQGRPNYHSLAFLHKPYAVSALREVAARMLAGSAAT